MAKVIKRVTVDIEIPDEIFEKKLLIRRVIYMRKDNGVFVMKKLTDVFSNQKNGTLHGYNYFEDESGEWVYNIDFHIDGCFAPVQLILPKRISITRAVQKARKIFENTKYCKQPEWND